MKLSTIVVFFFFATGLVQASQWQRIELPSSVEIEDDSGEERHVYPSCSGGPVSCDVDPTTGQQTNCKKGDTDFSFYYKQGTENKLVFYFDGGGACWDTTNCLIAPTYTPEPSNPDIMGSRFERGIFDESREQNPFKNWSAIYVPYCTGDLHVGSRDKKYRDVTGVLGKPNKKVTIHHRGFDNFLATLDWTKKHYSKRLFQGQAQYQGQSYDEAHKQDHHKPQPKKVFVTGSSAGSYGATFNYPWIRQAFPKAQGYLVADAGNAVINDEFADVVLFPKDGSKGPWNVRKNTARWLLGYDETLTTESADKFASTLFALTASYYPVDLLAQYTTSWDLVQMGFLNVMENIDNPLVWQDIQPPLICEWNTRATQLMQFNEQLNFNYNYYKAAGTSHTIMGLDLFYTEQSAGNKPFVTWIDDMLSQEPWQIYNSNVSWNTEQCDGDCGALFDPALCYQAPQ